MASEQAVADATDTPTVAAPVQEYLDEVKSGLNQSETVQLDSQIAPKSADGTLSENDVFQAKLDAEHTQALMNQAHELQHQQATDSHSGNYEGAANASGEASYDLKVADNLGAHSAYPTIDAQQDNQYHETKHLEIAQSEQSIAVSYANDASANLAVGDTYHAAQSAGTADAHEQTASDYGHGGEHVSDHTDTTPPPEPAPAAETSGETTP